MPDELDEIRRRLDVLESRMDSEAGLRAMMDLDQATLTARFDAQDNLLRALAVTQSDHTRRLTRLEGKLDRLEGKVDRLEGKVDGLEGKVDGLEGKVDGLEGKVDGLEGGQRDLQGAVARVEVGLQTIITLLSQDH
jgi:chromosome segregation ATPase